MKQTKLYACYDGKLGRAVPVRVVKVRGCFMLVEFQPWPRKQNTPKVRAWFPPAGGAWVRGKGTLMPMLYPAFSKEKMPGDWYRLVPRSRLVEAGVPL